MKVYANRNWKVNIFVYIYMCVCVYVFTCISLWMDAYGFIQVNAYTPFLQNESFLVCWFSIPYLLFLWNGSLKNFAIY